MSRFAPQPVADARRRAPGATAALVGGGARDPQRFEPAHAGGGVEALAALEAGIDDDAHAVDGEAGLGEVRGDDDLAAPLRVGLQGGVLGGSREVAVERQHDEALRRQDGLQRRGHAADFAGTGQEREGVARVRLERLHDAVGHLARERGRARARRRRGVDGLHVEHAAGCAHEARVVEHAPQRVGVERGRHHEQAQVRPQVPLALERQREPEVALQVALVELVEHHAGHALERGVALQHAGQDALGHDLEAGCRADAGLEPGPVTDARAGPLADERRHAFRDGPCSDAARLEHHDAAIATPAGFEQREGHDGALAGPGGRLEHDPSPVLQRRAEFGQRFDDRQ